MSFRIDATMEQFAHSGDGRLPGLIGFRPISITEGRVDAELEIRPELLAPNGYLHAASVVALADTACGYGCLAHLPADATGFTTIELKTNFLGTAREGTVGCAARAVHLGRTTHVWDATVFRKDDARKPIALFRCTQMILYGKR